MPLPCRTIYNMCTQKPPNDYSEQLYTRYRQSFSVYITERVRDFSMVYFTAACAVPAARLSCSHTLCCAGPASLSFSTQ